MSPEIQALIHAVFVGCFLFLGSLVFGILMTILTT